MTNRDLEGGMPRREWEIDEDDLSGEATRALLAFHLEGMHANSPPGHVFALDLSGLCASNVTVWSAWHSGAICGIGALKQIDEAAGEVKSMRTHPEHLRKGVAAAILQHIIDQARQRGLRTLSLETGRGPSFGPALALYRRRGFIDGEPFGEYERSDFNQFLHLTL
jgi:putative acetyltransferase